MPETTDAGQPETAPPRTAQPRRDAGISVAELRSKKVAIDWTEAIAVLQALCKTLCGPAGHVEAIRVDTDNVFIHADGSVSLTPGTRVDGVTVLQQLRSLLGELLPEESVRSPLRAVLFDPPPGSSVDAWSKSIEYYERQNRSLHIQALYERAVNAAVRMAAAGPSAVGGAPVSNASQAFGSVMPDISAKRLVAVMGIVIAVVAGITVTVARIADARLRGSEPPNEIRAPARVGPRAPQEHPASPAMAPPLAASSGFETTPTEPLASAEASPATVVSGASVQLTPIIYSQNDEDVIPPAPIDPRFPSVVPRGIKPDEFAEFDVVVTETGGVESVKARRVPGTMAEAVSMTMSLSAAKTWRFHPALKDGEPVKYRKTIWVLKN